MRWLGMLEPTWRKMMITLIALVIGVVMVISVIMMFRYRPPQKDEASRLYARFVAKTGLQPRTGETPRLFARRLQNAGIIGQGTIDTITEAYMEARYAGVEGAGERLRQAVDAMK
jgi:hypothetical protein